MCKLALLLKLITKASYLPIEPRKFELLKIIYFFYYKMEYLAIIYGYEEHWDKFA
jgi:hypothetical protein